MFGAVAQQDYPSVAHVAYKLKQKNIQTIFAVTQDVQHLYKVWTVQAHMPFAFIIRL